MDYRVQDHEKARLEALETIVKGCRGILGTSVRFRRGSLGDLKLALSQYTSLSFLPTVDFLKKHIDALRAEGIELTIHDAEGRDVELNAVAVQK